MKSKYLNSTQYEKDSALNLAVELRQYEKIPALVKKGANIDCFSGKMLISALYHSKNLNDPYYITMIIEQGADIHKCSLSPPLIQEIFPDQWKIIKHFLTMKKLIKYRSHRPK